MPEDRGPNEGDKTADPLAYDFAILESFERFSQRNDVLCRSWWDPSVRSAATELFYRTYRKPLDNWRTVDGFTQRDYSLRNAAWHIADLFAELKEDEDRREGFLDELTFLREGAESRVPVGSAVEMSAEIKRVARSFGADLVGVAPLDARWVYTHKYSARTEREKPNDLPDGLAHTIVIANEMDYELTETVPSALSGAATGIGYSRDAMALLSLSQYIRNLGYQAVPSMNDTALAVPLAIQAGLGEYGRHGILITPEFGPRVRLGKVFTDLPLENDRPVHFGVREFCAICKRCSQACPVKAIPDGAPSDTVHNPSNIRGVVKWSTNAELCFGFWAKQNSDCSICIRVCPYNKDYSKLLHRVGRWLSGTPLRRLMLKLDILLGYGARKPACSWWRKD